MTLGFLFIVLLCFICPPWIGANAACEPVCPLGWTQLGKTCYMFHRRERDWADAESFCNRLGGNLASLPTTDDYNFIRMIILRVTGYHKPTWVGGYDAVKEGTWQWSDGSRFTFTGWASGQPNNFKGKQHCMEINYGRIDYVNDTNCHRKKSFMCRKPLPIRMTNQEDK